VRHLRRILAVLIAISYLVSGVLHGLHDLDVTNPSGTSEVASALDVSTGHADHKAMPGHHCHGCFSVTVVQPARTQALTEERTAPQPGRQPAIAGVVPDTESPPPKDLA
jgi:hypothetical protein